MPLKDIETVTVPSDVAVSLTRAPRSAPAFTQTIVNAIQRLYALEELKD